MRTASIDGRDYAYSVDAEDGSYRFDIDGRSFCFRQWTWGDKNLVTDAATTTDPSSGRLRLNIARFNELMLASTLIGVTPESLRGLNPVLGDTLLAIACWVNELRDSEKKAWLTPSAVGSPTAT
jgi:hypothetical protein